MTLRPWLFVAMPVAALAAAYSGCSAEFEEGCLTGPCGATSSNAGVGGNFDVPEPGGAGGEGGGVDCEPDTFPSTGELPCEVSEVLHAKCQCCHQDPEQNNASFPLLTYADTHAPYGSAGRQRWQRMLEVIQADSPLEMPFPPAPDLTAAEKKVLDDWLKACAPPATAYKGGVDSCEGAEPPAASTCQ